MHKYTATVIKTGNSYALRVPKRYVEDAALTVGQKVQVVEPQPAHHAQDQAKIQKAFAGLQALHAFEGIKDPSSWQREIRKDRPLPGRE